ncbi:MAG: hypothetical protein IPO83_16615 [Chitinophagaceae bacterium]|nr:hypothetical protein [Chitinophagaceae bacterium]
MRFLFLFIATLTFTGCLDNEIYVDKEKWIITTCDKHSLTQMYIEKKGGVLYRIKLRKNGSGDLFALKGDNTEFEITVHDVVINEFKLEPNSFYKIVNVSNGDATGSTISLETDSNTNIKVISEKNCH